MTLEKIMKYEEGDLNDDEVIELFQELVDTGLAWRLQGHYGRMAHTMIEAGLLTIGETKNERN